MKNIIVTTFKIFSRNKAFVSSVVFIPTFMFLMMAVLLPYSEKHTITVINNTNDIVIENAIEDLDGVSFVDSDEDEILELISRGIIELAVVIDEDPVTGTAAASIISSGDCEIQNAVELAIEYASDEKNDNISSVNDSNRGKNNLMNTAAFMLNKFIQGASILGALIIADRKKHIKDRVMLSNVHPIKYLSGEGIVYFVSSCFGAGLYCLVALLMNFDFGMRTPLYYFIMMCFANLFASAFYIFASALVKSEEKLQGLSMLVLVTSFFSGMLFPFSYMPKAFRVIGNCCPQRWVIRGVEKIQEYGRFSAALPQIGLLIGFSAVLFTVGVFLCNKKTAKD